MELYILRHGDAGPNAATSGSDDARVLTDNGRAGIERLATFLAAANLEAPSLVIDSPLPRAKETAEIVKQQIAPGARTVTTHALLSGDPLKMIAEIAGHHAEHRTVLVVGHEPLLSMLVSYILSGSDRTFIEMEKGALVHISIYQMDPLRMRGYLKMMVSPSQLS